MTEAAAFKNRGDPARLQCFNYGAGEAPSVGRPRPRWQAGLDAMYALISVAHRSQAASIPGLPPVADASLRRTISKLGMFSSQTEQLKTNELFAFTKIVGINATHWWFVTHKSAAVTFVFQFARFAFENFTKSLFSKWKNSSCASFPTEAALFPTSFPLKSH